VNGARGDGASPLSIATARGYIPVIQLLLDNGADVSLTQQDGSDALYVAAGNWTKNFFH
jgi:ankyrin repeat protein